MATNGDRRRRVPKTYHLFSSPPHRHRFTSIRLRPLTVGIPIRFRRLVLAADPAALMLAIEAIARQSGSYHICEAIMDMKDSIRVGSLKHGDRKLPVFRPNYCKGVVMENWMFDGEGIEFSHLQRAAAFQQQAEMLKEAKRMREALERQESSRSKQTWKCPRCFADLTLPNQSMCILCSRKIEWVGGQPVCAADPPSATQTATTAYVTCPHCGEANDESSDECWECDGDLSGSAGTATANLNQPVQLGACLYACALLVAADGKVTPRELEIVIAGLEWSGMDREKLKQTFVDACKRVRKEGAVKWLEIVRKELVNNNSQSGMPQDDLWTLLLVLVEDGDDKMKLFDKVWEGLR
jgi:DNA-directed RNA polymerase subunit RPC12/RpoP